MLRSLSRFNLWPAQSVAYSYDRSRVVYSYDRSDQGLALKALDEARDAVKWAEKMVWQSKALSSRRQQMGFYGQVQKIEKAHDRLEALLKA